MIKIRLQKLGTKKKAYYRIVAIDERKKVTGQELSVIGFWNPLKKTLKADKEAVAEYIKKGAQMSATVKKLLEK